MAELSFQQIESLMRQADAKAGTPASSIQPWLTLSDIRTLLVALDNDAEQVYFAGLGRMYDIKYRDDKIWLSPYGDAFVPCGWFTPRDLRRQIGELSVSTGV